MPCEMDCSLRHCTQHSSRSRILFGWRGWAHNRSKDHHSEFLSISTVTRWLRLNSFTACLRFFPYGATSFCCSCRSASYYLWSMNLSFFKQKWKPVTGGRFCMPALRNWFWVFCYMHWSRWPYKYRWQSSFETLALITNRFAPAKTILILLLCAWNWIRSIRIRKTVFWNSKRQ